jgi:DnaJ-domain-containing protein 1
MAIVHDTALSTPGLQPETAQPWVLGPDGQVDLNRGFEQPDAPQAPDHFVVLGVPRRLLLDSTHVELRFRSLIRALHPDRFHVHGPEAEARAQWHTARVNDAVRVLRDLDKRIVYVLDQEPAATAVRFVPPPALLAMVFAANEAVDELEEQPDSATAVAELAALTADLRVQRQELTTRLQAVAAQWDDAQRAVEAAAPNAAELLTAASTQLRALRGEATYLDNLLARVAQGRTI